MYPFGKETGGMNDFFSRRRSRLLGTGGGVLLEKACAASKDRSVGKGGEVECSCLVQMSDCLPPRPVARRQAVQRHFIYFFQCRRAIP